MCDGNALLLDFFVFRSCKDCISANKLFVLKAEPEEAGGGAFCGMLCSDAFFSRTFVIPDSRLLGVSLACPVTYDCEVLVSLEVGCMELDVGGEA